GSRCRRRGRAAAPRDEPPCLFDHGRARGRTPGPRCRAGACGATRVARVPACPGLGGNGLTLIPDRLVLSPDRDITNSTADEDDASVSKADVSVLVLVRDGERHVEAAVAGMRAQ